MNPQTLRVNTSSILPSDMYVHVITLKEWLREQAYDAAWRMADIRQTSSLSNQLTEIAERTLATLNNIPLEEFIEIVSPSIIQIGVDRDTIDTNAVNYAISRLLAHIESNGIKSLMTMKRHRLSS